LEQDELTGTPATAPFTVADGSHIGVREPAAIEVCSRAVLPGSDKQQLKIAHEGQKVACPDHWDRMSLLLVFLSLELVWTPRLRSPNLEFGVRLSS
jgi:hypothetical protein